MGELCCRQEIHIPIAAYGSAAGPQAPGELGGRWGAHGSMTPLCLSSSSARALLNFPGSPLTAHLSWAVLDLCQHCLHHAHCLWSSWLWCQNVLLRILTHTYMWDERDASYFSNPELLESAFALTKFFPCFFFPQVLMSIRTEAWAQTLHSLRLAGLNLRTWILQPLDPTILQTSFHSQETHKQRKWTLFLLSAVHTSSRAARLWPSGFHYD